MGWGDDLIMTGEAKRAYMERPIPIYFERPDKRPYWSDLFEGNPKITKDKNTEHQLIVTGGGIRPYILSKYRERWAWNLDFRPERGEIFFTDQEKEQSHKGNSYIIVEPNVKRNGHWNKDLGWDKWVQFASQRTLKLAQLGPPGTRMLPYVDFIETGSFREACAVLSGAKALITTDGGLHHAAAALNVPAVVIWSEFTSPAFLGYDGQINIRHAGDPCGVRTNCSSCKYAMSRVTIKEMQKAIGQLL